MTNSRDIVLSILMDIDTNKTFSNIAISKALSKNQFSDKSDRAFITRLAEGVVEYMITLDYVINQYSKTKINKCKPMIRCILRMGAYQILFMDKVPDSAACNEAVKLAKAHGMQGLSGFVNGVLRTVSRNKDSIKYPCAKSERLKYISVKYSMPEWLVGRILEDYPEQGETIIEASFVERKTSIRVNTTKTSRESLTDMISEAGIDVYQGFYDEKALLIDNYDFIKRVPGYKQGLFTVQDESSMCAIRAAGIKVGDVVMDVCSAPGGKTTGAAEFLKGTGKIYSMDLSEDKLELIEENVNRLGFNNIYISAHNATELLENMIEKADVVIADVPCSGLGIIGRKNDIKYRLEESQMTELVNLQREILSVVHKYIKPGGTLLYSTCTINPSENQKNVEWFLENHPEFKLKEQRLFLQGIDKCDGFFYAVMKKEA